VARPAAEERAAGGVEEETAGEGEVGEPEAEGPGLDAEEPDGDRLQPVEAVLTFLFWSSSAGSGSSARRTSTTRTTRCRPPSASTYRRRRT